MIIQINYCYETVSVDSVLNMGIKRTYDGQEQSIDILIIIFILRTFKEKVTQRYVTLKFQIL